MASINKLSQRCDDLRIDIMQLLTDPIENQHQLSSVLNDYAEMIDSRDKLNNFGSAIEELTSPCQYMSDMRNWKPLASNPKNLDVLIRELNWPKTTRSREEIFNTLDEIQNSFAHKVKPLDKPEPRGINTEYNSTKKSSQENTNSKERNPILDDERLKNIDPNIAERILNEILDRKQNIMWSDIAGLQAAKTAINEIVVYPMLNPSIFKGLRAPAKGLLLFGPPGTGKTLIGKCIASQSNATFFAISASSLTSKWVGEGEKMVRALFAVARVMQPSVVFLDEIDSMLTHRSDTEHDSSRRMKTEFLVQFDGVSTESDDRILIIGATNRPQELDEAARRRFTKRLYIALPDQEARHEIVKNLLKGQEHSMTDEEISLVASRTQGFSGADMANLCKEAAMEPIRTLIKLNPGGVRDLDSAQVPPIQQVDFESALRQVKASVSGTDLSGYEDWNRNYGSVANDIV